DAVLRDSDHLRLSGPGVGRRHQRRDRGEQEEAHAGYETAASPRSAFTSAKKSGTGRTLYDGPSSSRFGPSDVSSARNTRASPGKSRTTSESSRTIPAGAFRASTRNVTSVTVRAASNSVTSIASSFVSPSC